MTTRICSRCLVEKPLTDFGCRPHQCKACANESWRNYMEEKKDRQRHDMRVALQSAINWPPPKVI